MGAEVEPDNCATGITNRFVGAREFCTENSHMDQTAKQTPSQPVNGAVTLVFLYLLAKFNLILACMPK